MPQPLTDDQLNRLSDALFQGRKIEAIKVYREATSLGLKESKDAVEEIEADLRARHPEKFAPSRGSGCLGNAALLCVGFVAGVAAAWWHLHA